MGKKHTLEKNWILPYAERKKLNFPNTSSFVSAPSSCWNHLIHAYMTGLNNLSSLQMVPNLWWLDFKWFFFLTLQWCERDTQSVEAILRILIFSWARTMEYSLVMLGSGSEPRSQSARQSRDKPQLHLKPSGPYGHSVFHFQYSSQQITWAVQHFIT